MIAQMKNKKVLLVVGSLLLIIGLIIIIMLVNTPKGKDLEEVLVTNDYELKNEFKEGTKGEEDFTFPRNTYRYQKGNIYLMVYEYDSLDEIKGIGHRVVQGGAYFDKTVIVDEDVINKIEE